MLLHYYYNINTVYICTAKTEATNFSCRCDNNKCVTKTKYCDGKNDCGDNSDEPSDCETSCLSLFKYLHPKKLCDGRIDCYHAKQDANHGEDEGSEACCEDKNQVRCVAGHIKPGNE